MGLCPDEWPPLKDLMSKKRAAILLYEQELLEKGCIEEAKRIDHHPKRCQLRVCGSGGTARRFSS